MKMIPEVTGECRVTGEGGDGGKGVGVISDIIVKKLQKS